MNYSSQPLNIDGVRIIGKLSGRGQRDRPTRGQGVSSAEVVRSWEDTYVVDYYYNKELQPLINGVSQDSNQR